MQVVYGSKVINTYYECTFCSFNVRLCTNCNFVSDKYRMPPNNIIIQLDFQYLSGGIEAVIPGN